MIPLYCAVCALLYSPQCHHMTFGSPWILSHSLLWCALSFVIFPFPTVTPFISFPSHVLLWPREAVCVDAGSELQAYQLVGQPLHLSRDEEQVLEKVSVSGALMLLSNVLLAAGQATRGVMAKQSDCRSMISPEEQTEITLYFQTCTEWPRRNPSKVSNSIPLWSSIILH